MASIRHLKRDINSVIGGLIEDVYIFEISNPDIDFKKSNKLIDNSISLFDQYIDKINNPSKEKGKKYFKEIQKEFKIDIEDLYKKLDKLTK